VFLTFQTVTDAVWITDILIYSKLLQESNLHARQSCRATSRYTGNCEWRTCPRSLCGG